MCGVSGVELIVVLAAALVIIGPDKLPQVMGALGKLMRQVRELTSELGNVRQEIVDTVPVKDLKKKVRDELGVSELTKVTKSATSEVEALRKRMRDMGDAAKSSVTTERISNAPKRKGIEGPTSAPTEAVSAESTESGDEPTTSPAASEAPSELSEIDAIRARLKAREAARQSTSAEDAIDRVPAAPHPSVPGMGASVQVGPAPAASTTTEGASDE